MKRIKTFAIFESADIEDSLLHDLEDLSLEIRDKGFFVEV